MMHNVVPIKTRAYAGVRDAEAAMDIIRDRLYGKDLSTLCKRVGVSQSCLYSIRAGRTKWPRHGTFFALLDVLDLEMIIRPRT